MSRDFRNKVGGNPGVLRGYRLHKCKRCCPCRRCSRRCGSPHEHQHCSGALMGHLFLRERLKLVHAMALVCSVTGAVLISRPQFIFGTNSTGSSYTGYLLALVSGFFNASEYICARKSTRVPVSFISTCIATGSGILFVILPHLPFVEDSPVSVALAEPLKAIGFTMAAFGLALWGIGAGSAGSKMCPAAVSATVYTASSMIFGYLAQTVFFNMVPQALTIVGATLMLVACALMTVSREPRSLKEGPAPGTDELSLDAPENADGVDTGADDDTESLFSFVASEFADIQPQIDVVRQRRPGKSAQPGAEQLGVSAAGTG
eukprot:TRINITY_DN29274_c0_g1_i1.p1 TRINITY_DN29274_c0_g1~~TRINITY_DN29274_c0_g1_i1.p1  ORF type:complete len:318 (+),score=36.22 TRINITY_DN29274_c0_g1_i1:278-1231(+)